MTLRSSPARALAAGALLLLVAACAPRRHAGGPPQPGTILREDPRFDALAPPGATLEKVADGLRWVEGPVWSRRDHCLLFSDIPANAVLRYRQGEPVDVFLHPSGYSGEAPFSGREPGSNGLAIDAEGRLILCQHGDRRVARLEADGTLTVLADRYLGRRLNSPNDVTLGPGGALYFTDPPFGLPGTFTDPARELDFSGVYRLSNDGELRLLTRELRAPNGLAFSPAGDVLYLSNAEPEHPIWLACVVRADATLGGCRTFFDATAWTKMWKGLPDGMKVDRAGNLFAAGPGGVHVFAPDGSHLGSIITGTATSNCAWGGDGSVLYITADTAVYRIQLATKGLGF